MMHFHSLWSYPQRWVFSETPSVITETGLGSHLLERLSSRGERASVGEDVEEREPLRTVAGNVSCFSLQGKQYGGFSEGKNRTIIWLINPSCGYISKINENWTLKRYLWCFPGLDWSRICLPTQGTWIQSLTRELRSYMLEQLGPGTTTTEAHEPQPESLCSTMKDPMRHS